MQKSWYRRMLFSYFPVFAVTVTILIFMSFIVVNDLSHKETVKADQISTGYIIDTVSRSLRGIEMNVLEEMQKNDRYREFLNVEKESNNRQIIFDVVDSIQTLSTYDGLIDSIYIYRDEDQQVLTRSGLVNWGAFEDRAFIEQALDHSEFQGWSPVRSYNEMSTEKAKQVISMYKREPLPFGEEGLVVINVNTYAVERMIRSMNNDDVSFLDVRDEKGNLLFSTRASALDDQGLTGGRVLNQVHSDMLGLTFESGIIVGQLFMWVSVISYVWIVIGLLTILLAIVYIFYITRKNYKPIRVMMNRIESIQLSKSGFGIKMDDLSMIDRTLESLIQQASDYEKQQHHNLLVSRRQLFLDIIQGEQHVDLAERLLNLKLLPEGASFDRVAFIVVEISKYGDFRSGFSTPDQHTLKFALTNVLQELAHDDGMHGWAEWIGDNRMGIIIGMNEEERPAKERIRLFVDKGRTWVFEHLRMTLMFGVGPVMPGWDRIEASYKAATDAMQHKLALGKEAIIMSEDLPGDASSRWYKHLQMIAEFIREFRLSTGEWRYHLEKIFECLESDCLKDEDIRKLLQTMMDMLGSELGDISNSLLEHFKGNKADIWKIAVEETASLEQLKALFFEYLTEIYRTYVAFCETKSHRAMINEMKAYIEEHFVNPDLSLKHLSDRFQISGKYASYLFKEEFNMKFVDFIVQLRISHAEVLLAETEDSVQSIALQVGYANSITFGRMFKKVVGVTPGDFRKLRMKPAQARQSGVL